MDSLEIKYRPFPIVLATAMFTACAMWLYFGPSTSGPTGQLLGSDNGLSFVSIAAISVSLVMAILFGIHVFRMFIGLPAIKVDQTTLSIYVVPFRKFDRGDIKSIDYDASAIVVSLLNGRERRIRAPLLQNYDANAQLLKNSLINPHEISIISSNN